MSEINVTMPNNINTTNQQTTSGVICSGLFEISKEFKESIASLSNRIDEIEAGGTGGSGGSSGVTYNEATGNLLVTTVFSFSYNAETENLTIGG